MGNSYFRFKKFNVEQENVSMRVNTDGVLLGAWCSVPFSENAKALDIGSGTGVIALMLAQRLADAQAVDCSVEAVEIDGPSSVQCLKNFTSSPWRKTMKVYNADFQSFAMEQPQKYNLVVSNPPYFNNSLKNPSEVKKTARHTDSLSYDDLADGASKLLVADGILSVILPWEESSVFASVAEEKGFCIKRKCNVFSKRGEEFPKRVLMELSLKKNAEILSEDLCIMEHSLEFTPEYRNLTKDFYLKF